MTALLLVLLLVVAMWPTATPNRAEPAAVSVEETQVEPEVVEEEFLEAPTQLGEPLTLAMENLELEGFLVEAVSEAGDYLSAEEGWTVVGQEQFGDVVVLTAAEDEPEADSPPAEELGSFAQECLPLEGPLAEANLAIALAYDQSADPVESSIDVYRELGDAFEKGGKEVTDKTVAKLAANVGRDAHRTADAMHDVLVKDNIMGSFELIEAQEAFAESYDKLMDRCGY